MRQPIDLVGGFYTDDSLPWSVQDTVNYLPVAAEAGGTRTPTKLVDAPGLRPFQAIGNTDGDPTAGAPIRGLHDVEGRLFVVSGQMLYEVGQSGVAIPRGTIPGVGRVSMAHNQRSHGHELLVVNGSGGYVYNTATDTFTIVTDPGYPGAGVADFLDGYLMQVEPFGRFLFHSDLADALEYNTLDRFEAETQPDRVVGMIVNHQEVWAFGDRTIDVFGNVGTAQGTFQNKGVSISRGCIAKWSPAIIDNGVAWLGDDRVVYHARGYDPARISTRAIEVALSQCSLADIRNAFSFVWSDRGHSVYYLTVPNGLTFGYDFSTGLWHRRATWHPERDMGGRWRLADLVRHNGQWIGGDYHDGRLYALDWDYMLEGCEPLVRDRVAPLPHNDGRGINVHSVELLYDTGGSESECGSWPVQPVGPAITGNAPDSEVGDPYEYAYTVTPGSSPIVSTLITSGTLVDGLSWDPLTATISGTPAQEGRMNLRFRTYDENGLFDDHDDYIAIGLKYDFVAAVGINVAFGRVDGVWSRIVPGGGVGTRVRTWGQRVIVFGSNICRYSDDYFDTYVSVTPPWGSSEVTRPFKTPSGRIYVVAGGADVYYTDDGAETWNTITNVGAACRRIAGDDDAIYVLDGATLHISTDGDTFTDSKPLPRSPTDMAYRDGVLMFPAALGLASFKSEDGGAAFDDISSPSAFECYSTFCTSAGRWIFAHRINNDNTNHLIGRLNNAGNAISFVSTPAANYDGGPVDIFAERNGVVVTGAGLEGAPPFMCILQTDAEAEDWVRVDHDYPNTSLRPSSIAAFPVGEDK